MKIIKLKKNFNQQIKTILKNKNQFNNKKLSNDVQSIIKDVEKNGDDALLKYTKKFDKIDISKNNLYLNLKNYKRNSIVDKNILKSFKTAIKNIKKFHQKQFPKNIVQNEKSVVLKSEWKPIDSVGLYVPGGKAFYPSSLLMNAVPAKIAGVRRIVCVTPPSNEINPFFITLLKELDIKETYFVGGAQAIAALTYGTKIIKPVNKIFGPGNAYVAEAKKQLFGKVGIDLLAGPSEIVVIANSDNNPNWVAADLMAQAEHDENAQSILITDSNKFAKEVILKIKILSKKLNNKKIIQKSLKNNGICILINNVEKSADLINFIAPEHLHIHIKSYKKLLSQINNAGGIFVGEYSAEAFGDYIVGTNHVLPTSGAAKYSSGLGVLDFMKRNSVININSKSFNLLSNDTAKMAEVEGLEAHKLSVKIRQNK